MFCDLHCPLSLQCYQASSLQMVWQPDLSHTTVILSSSNLSINRIWRSNYNCNKGCWSLSVGCYQGYSLLWWRFRFKETTKVNKPVHLALTSLCRQVMQAEYLASHSLEYVQETDSDISASKQSLPANLFHNTASDEAGHLSRKVSGFYSTWAPHPSSPAERPEDGRSEHSDHRGTCAWVSSKDYSSCLSSRKV